MNWGTRYPPAACIAAAVVGLPFAAMTIHAAPFDREIKLTPSDLREYDYFGLSVAISGSRAIAGAHNHDGAGTNAGAAYLFEATTGNQLFKLIPSDATRRDQFGASVAISGSMAIVGAPLDDNLDGDAGSAYLFDVTTGDQLFKLTASDTEEDDYFGGSVAISGNTAIVGALRDDHADRVDAGSAYLFDVTTGRQILKFTPSDAASGDLFGYPVGVSGNTAVVGARQTFVGNGYACLFDVTTGNQLFKLTASDAGFNDNFGDSVAISGNTAIVGSPGNDEKGINAGAAYLYDVTTGAQLHKLTSSDIRADDQFGDSVAISGNLAIVGAPLDDDSGGSSGSAYVFDVTTGEQLFKLTASDGFASEEFGKSVAISGKRAIVGAWEETHFENAAGKHSGAAYLFVPEPSTLALTASSVCLAGFAGRRSKRAVAVWSVVASQRAPAYDTICHFLTQRLRRANLASCVLR